jgi:hypothetical protein
MILAIDPGANGGIAVEYAGTVSSYKMPATDGDLLHLLQSCSKEWNKKAYLENIVKYAGTNMPSSSMAVYASSWGLIKGMLMALEFEVILVKPQDWQKGLGLGTSKGLSKTEWKNKLKGEAQRLYPGVDVTLATADALLMLRAAKNNKIG